MHFRIVYDVNNFCEYQEIALIKYAAMINKNSHKVKQELGRGLALN